MQLLEASSIHYSQEAGEDGPLIHKNVAQTLMLPQQHELVQTRCSRGACLKSTSAPK